MKQSVGVALLVAAIGWVLAVNVVSCDGPPRGECKKVCDKFVNECETRDKAWGASCREACETGDNLDIEAIDCVLDASCDELFDGTATTKTCKEGLSYWRCLDICPKVSRCQEDRDAARDTCEVACRLSISKTYRAMACLEDAKDCTEMDLCDYLDAPIVEDGDEETGAEEETAVEEETEGDASETTDEETVEQ